MTARTSVQIEPPSQIPAPGPLHFDVERRAWIASRYVDVVAAFREEQLWPVGTRGQNQSMDRDANGRLTFRGDLQHALSLSLMGAWQEEIEAVTRTTLDHLSVGRAVDLLKEVAEPVCLTLAMGMTRACPVDRQRLSGLGAQVFGKVGTPAESDLRPLARDAAAELARALEKVPIPRAEQTFMGIAKTLPRLVTSGWVALFRHPSEVARLRAEPNLMPRAVEELLRYAPTVQVIARRAMADITLNGQGIPAGAQVNLMLASANRDPDQFPEPDRLDVSRRPASQAALGIGRDSCAGAAVVRMVFAVTTAALLASYCDIALTGPVEWHSGPESCWPDAAYVTFRRETVEASRAGNA